MSQTAAILSWFDRWQEVGKEKFHLISCMQIKSNNSWDPSLLPALRSSALFTGKHIFHLPLQTFAKVVLWNYKCGFKIMSREVPQSHLQKHTHTHRHIKHRCLPHVYTHTHTHLYTLQPYHTVNVMAGCANCCSAPMRKVRHKPPKPHGIISFRKQRAQRNTIHQAVTLTSFPSEGRKWNSSHTLWEVWLHPLRHSIHYRVQEDTKSGLERLIWFVSICRRCGAVEFRLYFFLFYEDDLNCFKFSAAEKFGKNYPQLVL